jgi:hypothetical protein
MDFEMGSNDETEQPESSAVEDYTTLTLAEIAKSLKRENLKLPELLDDELINTV